MSVITEVHNEKELYKALKLDVECIGINNRNLKTLKIDLRLSKNCPQKFQIILLKFVKVEFQAMKKLKSTQILVQMLFCW